MRIVTKLHQDVIWKQAPRSGRCVAACIFILALAAARLSAEGCGADCTHPTKTCLCVVGPGTGTISLTPIGSVERQAVKLGQALEIGDELSNTGDMIGELRCPGGSEFKLQERFRVVILPSVDGQDCAVSLLAGSADVLTDKPTQLEAGETVMGSVRTQYRMRVWRDAGATNVECIVFEGEARVQNMAARWQRALTSQSKATWTGGRLVGDIDRVSQKDIESASLLYARTDVARLQSRGVEVTDPSDLQAKLVQSYAAVLARPSDTQPRIALAALQTDARIPKQALYHLAKAETMEPQQEEQVAIAATKFVAYTQIGREEEAAQESEKVRKMDPVTYDRLRRLNPEVLKPAIEQRRNTDPATQRLQSPAPSLQRSQADPAAVQAPAVLQPSRAAISTPEATSTQAVTATPQQARQRPTLRSATQTRSLPAPLVIEVSSRPASVSAGNWATVRVTVATQNGQAVAGAQVTLSAGGGSFRESRTAQTTGATDAYGIFETFWTCQPCAPSYGISIEVAKEGFAAGKSELTVGIE